MSYLPCGDGSASSLPEIMPSWSPSSLGAFLRKPSEWYAHPPRTAAVSTTVTTQYIQIYVDAMRWSLLKSKNVVEKKVATKVAGRKKSVMRVIARMSLLWRYDAAVISCIRLLSSRDRLASSRLS